MVNTATRSVGIQEAPPHPSRSAGLERLEAFLPQADRRYAAERNYDYGRDAHAAVSGLSPWLRHRLVHEREVLAAVVAHHGYRKPEKFIQEVFWRAYFKGWLEHHPQAWSRYCEDLVRLTEALHEDAFLAERYHTAMDAETGIVPFDSWIRELRDSGYLHNHARMWFASIWVHTLRLPWQLGAEFFLRHLLDGDPASNTLSWRWVVGLHTRGKVYQARADNIARYAGQRFGPLSELASQLANEATPLDESPLAEVQPDLAWPSADPARAGWLFTEDDLSLPGFAQPPSVVAGLLLGQSAYSPAVTNQVLQFKRGALDDTLERAVSAFADADHDGCLASTVESVVEWACRRTLSHVVMKRPAVGAGSAFADALEVSLAESGVTLIRQPDAYDTAVWPHARRGFFQLKKRIPDLLERLGIEPA